MTLINTTLGQTGPHRAVLENDALEDRLPPSLKNPFYRTPRVRDLLERSSWFGPGESPVSFFFFFLNFCLKVFGRIIQQMNKPNA